MVGVATGPPNVAGLPNPESSIRTSSTLGAPSGGSGVMLIDQSGTDSLSVLPSVPAKPGSPIGSLLRSGTNLPIASVSEDFSPLIRPVLSDSTSARSIASRSSSGNTAMTPAEPGGSTLPSLSAIPVLSLWSANLPASAPAAPPTAAEASSGGANSPTTTPTPAPHPRPFRPA